MRQIIYLAFQSLIIFLSNHPVSASIQLNYFHGFLLANLGDLCICLPVRVTSGKILARSARAFMHWSLLM
uniref:Uncharacterized protein n=1 Tax=Rhizophora mucronata TaxID=61149 RepID=A0A2P2JZQ0_RHIMU